MYDIRTAFCGRFIYGIAMYACVCTYIVTILIRQYIEYRPRDAAHKSYIKD